MKRTALKLCPAAIRRAASAGGRFAPLPTAGTRQPRLGGMADSPNASSGAAARWLPSADGRLERFGSKFSRGGSHSSRTMMSAELETVLAAVRAPVTEQLQDGPVML